jgi:hypothetical protein
MDRLFKNPPKISKSLKNYFPGRKKMKFLTQNIGFLLLAVYLILQGLGLLIMGFTLPPMVLGVLAILAGIFILIGK